VVEGFGTWAVLKRKSFYQAVGFYGVLYFFSFNQKIHVIENIFNKGTLILDLEIYGRGMGLLPSATSPIKGGDLRFNPS